MKTYTKIAKIISVFALVSLMGAGCDIFLGSGQTQNAGILRSADGGTDWQFSNTMKDAKQVQLSRSNISQIKLKPNAPEMVYASTFDNGMFVSDDGGTNWNQILSKFGIYDFSFDPSNQSVIYASGISGNHGRVLVTRDAGKTWQEIYNEGTSNNVVETVFPDTSQRIYIGLDDGNLVRSDDGGLSWKLVQNFNSQVNSISSSNGTLYVLVRGKGLFKSADGFTFTNTTGSVGEGNSSIPVLSTFTNVGTYSNFVIGPTSIYLATDNGVFRSLDQGATWMHLTLPVQDQHASITALAIGTSNDSLVYTAVNYTIYKSTDGGNSWQTQNSNAKIRVSALRVNPNNTQLVYAGVSQINK